MCMQIDERPRRRIEAMYSTVLGYINSAGEALRRAYEVMKKYPKGLCEFRDCSILPSGKIKAGKFALNLTLMLDIFLCLFTILTVINLQMQAATWGIQMSIFNFIIITISTFVMFTTLYAQYGLLSMKLQTMSYAFGLWGSSIVSYTLFSIFVAIQYVDIGILNIHAFICEILHKDDYSCSRTDDSYVFLSLFVGSLVMISFKVTQMFLFNEFSTMAIDMMATQKGKRSPSSKGLNEEAVEEKKGETTDSEDEEDVIVFERVLGKYPGGMAIKDNSIDMIV